MVLDRDDGVPQIRIDLLERNVAALLVHAEPRAPVGRVEPRVADAAPQLVDRPPLPHRPDDGDRRDGDEARIQPRVDAVPRRTRHLAVTAARRDWSTRESTR